MRSSSLLLVLSSTSIAWGWVAPVDPMITPAPAPEYVELRKRQSVDLASVLPVLETAVPPSILALALTNVPAVSRLLWSEFLDNKTPAWFAALPTDIQTYLKGQFGPTTTTSHSSSSAPASTSASATSSATQSASANQTENPTASHHHSGLPLWAKILIGVLVPLLILALLALLLLCCIRRRRHRRAARNNHVESRAPTPAFISSSYGRHNAHDSHQNIPLNSGYLSAPAAAAAVAEERHAHHNHHASANSSSDFHTPIGGPSYEEIPPPAAAGAVHHSRRSSRQSLSSLHSVPEIPEPTHGRGQPHITSAMNVPAPPRSPRRSRDFSHELPAAAVAAAPAQSKHERRVSPLNPAYSNFTVGREMGSHPYYNQGVYATDGPYQAASSAYNENPNRRSDPFADSKRYEYNTGGGYGGNTGGGGGYGGNTGGGGYGGSAGGGYGGSHGHDYEPEPFLRNHERRQNEDFEWPLKSPPGIEHSRRMSWERGDDYQAPY